MPREFEIFSKAGGPAVAVKRGFSWPAFIIAFGISAAGSVFLKGADAGEWLIRAVVCLGLGLSAGFRRNSWRSRSLERKGYRFMGVIPARSPSAAVAAVARGQQPGIAAPRAASSFLSIPAWFQHLFAVASLTWKAAFRFRLFLVLAILLLASVVALPILIKDDGTARGFTQILLTYTLSVITALLGLSTLWLSCGTLARDIEECQIQMVAVKPVARWQIWLGKWIGIMSLNAALLALAGASVYGLLMWRATKLPAAEQEILRNEVLVARGSLKEENYDREIQESTEQVLRDRLAQDPVAPEYLPEVRRQIAEQIKAQYQVVQPGYVRTWRIDLGSVRNSLRDRPLQLRVKFNSAQKSPTGTFVGIWQVGVPEKRLWRSELMSLAPDTLHEFVIPPNLFDDEGVLTIDFRNVNNTALLFPLEDGMEVLYREGGFGLNFARGLGIIFCWMALLGAIGLASATFLSFPVAAFLSLGLLAVVFSTGTLTAALQEGTIFGFNHETGPSGPTALDKIVLPVFSAMLKVINLAKQFSPIDALSTGRSISWGELGRAVGQVIVLLGGIIGLIGVGIFNRRELATAQGTQ